MKWFLLIVISLCASTALAYNSTSVEPEETYAVILLEADPYVENEYLGDLDGYPEMFELTSEVSFDLKLQLRQRDSKHKEPFGLIVVRQDDEGGGVTEVTRLKQALEEWKQFSSAALGMSFVETDPLTLSLPPGTYRVEVSTPDNKGRYMLVVGDESTRQGYFSMLANIRETQKHFGYTIFHLLFSLYYYLPIGLFLILFGYRKYKQQRVYTI